MWRPIHLAAKHDFNAYCRLDMTLKYLQAYKNFLGSVINQFYLKKLRITGGCLEKRILCDTNVSCNTRSE